MTDTATVPSLLPVAPEGVTWTTRSLAVVDPTLTLDRFEELLRAAGEVKTASSFWLGDLLNFGEARYGERYAQAVEASGLSYSTLSNYSYVCRRIAPARRREKLRFGHHAEVAALEPADQDLWLGKAEENDWTREQLRDAMKTAAVAARSGPETGTSTSTRRKVPAAQEVLEAPAVVDASRDLGVVREALEMTRDALVDGATVVGLEERLPGALRALDDVGRTVTAAAQKMAAPSLIEAGHTLASAATHSGGFAMIPDDTFNGFLEALRREGR